MSLTNAQLDKIIMLLPGYDPVATAEGCRFDYDAARLYIDFIEECCTFTQGARTGQLFVMEDWERAIVANLFGWKRPDGSRRYRECLLFVARGNGKSELAAAIICAVLYLDEEPGAQLYSAASKRDQTHFIFNPCKTMIRACPQMNDRAQIFKNSIVVGDRSYKCISREATSEHGGSTHFAVIDELHAQPDRDLVDVLYTSTIKRSNPIILYVTTSDFDRPGSICNEKHDYACKVRDGVLPDVAFLPAIFEAEITDDWTDPETWRKANPNLGVSIRREDLAKLCQKAQDVPSFLNTFKRLHLNIRTETAVCWLPMETWDACPGLARWDEFEGQECYCGLDLSTTTDISAFAMVFPQDAGRYAVLCRFWIPEENAHQREKRDRVPYQTWARQGWITTTPGNSIDYDVIRRDIGELGKRFNIREIAADRWNSTQLIQQLEGDGFTIFAFGQGFKDMTSPTKELERLILAGALDHGGNPVLRWMASNVSVEQDAAGNMKPSKKKSTERIDGIVATIMGLARATIAPGEGVSIYETRGIWQPEHEAGDGAQSVAVAVQEREPTPALSAEEEYLRRKLAETW
jgi:phage terminase large subunit-like protein